MIQTRTVDCGTNEELFLAIAALRNDTDKNQWFTDGDKWILCPEIKFSTYWVYNDVDVNLDVIHKATVNELIEHFKTKEEQKEEHYDRRTCNIRNSEVAERERV